ncbi:hypothetical protein PMZ80_009632 [Knufia obscura]|uniref:Uncharacterized protein n=2 Tax=Knufia TaxID=430999 RepID=A0AAN8EGP8_9EURO|nr:hypothetical protein PMZ80_009632 [Knufia obscura]KAK5951083.1 hypothetical protein OHC33_007836 [Knufia fluminis]
MHLNPKTIAIVLALLVTVHAAPPLTPAPSDLIDTNTNTTHSHLATNLDLLKLPDWRNRCPFTCPPGKIYCKNACHMLLVFRKDCCKWPDECERVHGGCAEVY